MSLIGQTVFKKETEEQWGKIVRDDGSVYRLDNGRTVKKVTQNTVWEVRDGSSASSASNSSIVSSASSAPSALPLFLIERPGDRTDWDQYSEAVVAASSAKAALELFCQRLDGDEEEELLWKTKAFPKQISPVSTYYTPQIVVASFHAG